MPTNLKVKNLCHWYCSRLLKFNVGTPITIHNVKFLLVNPLSKRNLLFEHVRLKLTQLLCYEKMRVWIYLEIKRKIISFYLESLPICFIQKENQYPSLNIIQKLKDFFILLYLPVKEELLKTQIDDLVFI